ncbi:hypothetical protein BDV18DRAFT_111488 [Aspergillus unguis]
MVITANRPKQWREATERCTKQTQNKNRIQHILLQVITHFMIAKSMISIVSIRWVMSNICSASKQSKRGH